MFGNDEIVKRVNELLTQDDSIPDGHKAALVTVVNQDKMEIALGTKINQHWVVRVIASHSHTGDNEFGVVSKMTW